MNENTKQFREKLLYLKTPSDTCSNRVGQTSMFWADDCTGIVHTKFFQAEEDIVGFLKKLETVRLPVLP
jgi:hypothetical protein